MQGAVDLSYTLHIDFYVCFDASSVQFQLKLGCDFCFSRRYKVNHAPNYLNAFPEIKYWSDDFLSLATVRPPASDRCCVNDWQAMKDNAVTLKKQDELLTSLNESFCRERQQLSASNETLTNNISQLEDDICRHRAAVQSIKEQVARLVQT